MREQRVAISSGCERSARFFFDAVQSIVDERASSVSHYAGCFTAGDSGLLGATQRGFHGVNIHYDVGERSDDFLLLGELFAEFLYRCARGEQENFLCLSESALFFSECPGRRFFEGGPGQNSE